MQKECDLKEDFSSGVPVDGNRNSCEEKEEEAEEAGLSEEDQAPVLLQVINSINSNEFVSMDCERAFGENYEGEDYTHGENSPSSSNGENIRRIICRLKQSATEITQALNTPEQVDGGQRCDQVKLITSSRHIQQPCNEEGEGNMGASPSPEDGGQFGAWDNCDWPRENIQRGAAMPACGQNSLSSVDEPIQSLCTAMREIEKVIQCIGASRMECPPTTPSLKSSPYSQGFLNSPQLHEWIGLLQNLAQCMQPNAQFPNNDFKSMIMCTVKILQDIEKSLEDQEFKTCTTHAFQPRSNGHCGEYADKPPIIGSDVKELTESPLLSKVIEMLEKIVLSLRPNATLVGCDLDSWLSCLLLIVKDIVQTECLDSCKLQTFGKLLKCLEGEICRQGKGDSDHLLTIHSIQATLRILNGEVDTDGHCAPTQCEVTLQKTPQLVDIITQLQNLVLCSRPDAVFPSCDIQSTILSIILFLKDSIQCGIVNVSVGEKMIQQLVNLKCEVMRQGLNTSTLTDTIQELQQYIEEMRCSRGRQMDPCQTSLKETPNLYKIVVILQKAIQHIKNDAQFAFCDLESRILGLLKILKDTLQSVCPDEKVVKRLEKVMRCLECEVFKQGIHQSAINSAIVEIQQSLQKLQTNEPGAWNQGRGVIRETPQITEAIGKLRELIQCMTPSVSMLGCDIGTMLVGLLGVLKKAITPTTSMPETVEKMRQMLKGLECEIRNQGACESKVLDSIHEIQYILTQSANTPQMPSNEAFWRALNSLITANTSIKNLEQRLRRVVESPLHSKEVSVGRVVEYSGACQYNQESTAPPSAEAPIPVEY
ncbi:unnamed protein product, partial [Hydatigera taeniaeformis]|uniref:Protein kinase domain-containing protein n=1 Tax=Hydatigena taeniaeformis TaxID=6205 RepID=A0A0R3X907_HYDTA